MRYFGYVTVVVVAVAIIVAGVLLGNAYNYKFKTRNTISVVGSEEHNFTSDLIVWSATYTRTSMTLTDAYTKLKEDEKKVRDYLRTKSLPDSEVVFSAIVIEKQYSYQYDQYGRQTSSNFNGYQLSQTCKIQSKNIAVVEKVSREITELLQSGIELSSQEPMYFYTRLSDLKIALLEKASADAYNRAKAIAQNAQSSLGTLRKASMGVFQITGQYSNENFTYGGALNTSSKDKTATITVKLEYELD